MDSFVGKGVGRGADWLYILHTESIHIHTTRFSTLEKCEVIFYRMHSRLKGMR